jgi:hypothetical protein
MYVECPSTAVSGTGSSSQSRWAVFVRGAEEFPVSVAGATCAATAEVLPPPASSIATAAASARDLDINLEGTPLYVIDLSRYGLVADSSMHQ